MPFQSPLKHFSPILSSPSWRITLVRLLQSSNAYFPIDLTVFGMTISLIEAFLNHFYPMILSPSGNLIVYNLLHPLNAPHSISLMLKGKIISSTSVFTKHVISTFVIPSGTINIFLPYIYESCSFAMRAVSTPFG